MNWPWGHTGASFLDYWTISHFAFWVVVGSTVAAAKGNRVMAFAFSCAVASGWEVFEVFAEKSWPTLWLSPESMSNKLSDILTVPAGMWLSFFGFDRWRPK